MGDDINAVAAFCQTCSVSMSALLNADVQSTAQSDAKAQARRALGDIYTSAKTVNARAIMRVCQSAIRNTDGVRREYQLHGNILALNKLIRQYVQGYAEISGRSVAELSMSGGDVVGGAISPRDVEIFSGTRDANTADDAGYQTHAAARELLTALMPLATRILPNDVSHTLALERLLSYDFTAFNPVELDTVSPGVSSGDPTLSRSGAFKESYSLNNTQAVQRSRSLKELTNRINGVVNAAYGGSGVNPRVRAEFPDVAISEHGFDALSEHLGALILAVSNQSPQQSVIEISATYTTNSCAFLLVCHGVFDCLDTPAHTTAWLGQCGATLDYNPARGTTLIRLPAVALATEGVAELYETGISDFIKEKVTA